MEVDREIKNRLVAFRVTADEHELLSRHALADHRTLTGLLRNLVTERVVGFGSSKRERKKEWEAKEL
jgi:hypothetical protein